LGLAHTIGLAVLKGLLTDNEPFFRTPKQANSQTLWGALQACREEALIAVALLLSAWAVTYNLSDGSLDRMRMDSPDLRAWVLVMVVQSLPYLSALTASIISSLNLPARFIGNGYEVIEGGEAFATVVAEPIRKSDHIDPR
jgi:hypothetical protein